MPATAANIAETVDGMTNVISRLENALGSGAFGKSGSWGWITGNQHFLTTLYRSNWLARRVVDCVADDMGRDGIDLSVPGDEKAVEAFQRVEKETGLWTAITDGCRWGRLFGGAIAVMLLDGQDPAGALDPMTVGRNQFKGFMVFDRWEVEPSEERVTTLGKDFGTPLYYTIRETNVRIHYTRVIRFVGSTIPNADRKMERSWTASVLEKVVDELTQVKDSSTAVAKLLGIAHLRVMAIKDYRRMIAEGGDVEDRVIKHYTAIARMQDLMGMTLLDAEDQFFTNTYAFAGITDVQCGQLQQVSGASGIPIIRLLGQGEGGLNANGEASERGYFDEVARDQERDLRPALERVIPVTFQSTLGGVPADWSFSFRSLYQMQSTEKAAVVKQEVDTIIALQDAGIFDRERAIREIMEVGKRHERFPHLDDKAMAEILMDAPPMSELPGFETERSHGEEETGEATGLFAE